MYVCLSFFLTFQKSLFFFGRHLYNIQQYCFKLQFDFFFLDFFLLQKLVFSYHFLSLFLLCNVRYSNLRKTNSLFLVNSKWEKNSITHFNNKWDMPGYVFSIFFFACLFWVTRYCTCLSLVTTWLHTERNSSYFHRESYMMGSQYTLGQNMNSLGSMVMAEPWLTALFSGAANFNSDVKKKV